MAADEDWRDVLVNENAVNRRYLDAVATRAHHRVARYPRGQSSASPAGMPRAESSRALALVGRVGLIGASETLDGLADFYIGSTRHDGGTWQVYSWAAPVAAAFFDRGGHELCTQVRVRRSFAVQVTEIVGYDDHVVHDVPGPSPFGAGRQLAVPRPPSAPPRDQAPPPTPPKAPEPPPATVRPATPPPATPAPAAPPTGIRAPAAVLAAVMAPRQGQLASMLGTLQPDQYDAVTHSERSSLIVQGHPGTGKTIIATHRAAYLGHPDRTGGATGSVLLIGPTSNYARHVGAVVRQLDEGARVTVAGLEGWLRTVADITETGTGSATGEYLATTAGVLALYDTAARLLRAAGRTPRGSPSPEAAWEAVRANRVGAELTTTDESYAAWARTLPDWRAARRRRRFLPALAACAVATDPLRVPQFEHVVVDEAQDVRPLEWALLARTNPEGTWTLVGDVNQRRADHSHADWEAVIAELALDAGTVQRVELALGYRSTRPIMEFANRLLAGAQPAVSFLREEGPAPAVVKVDEADLPLSALARATQLATRHPMGRTAIVTTTPAQVIGVLRDAEWENVAPQEWVRNEVVIHLLTPDDARGIEFDGVLIVEPATFPPGPGAAGPLYTSLTRANQELVVVHALPLPRALRE